MSNKFMTKKSGSVLIIVLAVVMVTLLIIVAVIVFSGNNEASEETSDKVAAATSETSKDDAKQENKQDDREDGEEDKEQETRGPTEEAADEDDQQVADKGTDEVKETPMVVLSDLLDIFKGGTGDSSGDQPTDPISAVLDLARKAVKTGETIVQEAIGLDVDEENELGAAVHKHILETHKVVDSSETQARIQKLANPLLAKRTRTGINYTFTIVEDDSINAFALPGGYVYVHTGLLKFVINDAELQSVLGHEIGHVDLKHCVNSYTLGIRAAQATSGAGEMPVSELYNFYELQFREDDEFEADKYGYINMRKLGHSKEAALSFDRRMIDYYKSHGIETGQQDAENIPERIGQEFDNHFRTHPPSEERLKRLEALKIPGIDD